MATMKGGLVETIQANHTLRMVHRKGFWRVDFEGGIAFEIAASRDELMKKLVLSYAHSCLFTDRIKQGLPPCPCEGKGPFVVNEAREGYFFYPQEASWDGRKWVFNSIPEPSIQLYNGKALK